MAFVGLTVGLLRLRIVLVSAMGALLAFEAGDIFDQQRWELLITPAVVCVAAVVLATQGRVQRIAGAATAIVIGVVSAALLAGGNVDDALDAFTSGPQRILTTEWPSPLRPDLVATTALGLGVLIALAAGLARRAQLHLSPLLPIVVAQTLVIALSAPRGARMLLLIPLGFIAVVFALLRPGVGIRERWTQIRGERQALPVTAVVFALVALVAVPLSTDERSDPRRNDAPERTERLIDPIEATIALQDIEPRVLHVARLDEASQMPSRWRTAALDEYDGRRWEPSLELREIGGRLAADEPGDIVGTVSFLDDDLQLVPLPGAPVTVDADIQTDSRRTLVRLSERPADGLTVGFHSRPGPTNTDQTLQVASRPVDENVSGLTELAETIVEDAAPNGIVPTDLLGRLRLIESTMRGDDFLLDSEAVGGGLQRALIVFFLRESRRGNAEQFVTAFVLLARSLGVDARVATGFVIDPSTATVDDESGALTAELSSADAKVWPEVNVGGDWLAFDPVPEQEAVDVEPEPEEPPEQAPAAPQPPNPPPPESAEEPEVTETDESAEAQDALPTVVVVGLQAAAVTGALLVPIVLVVLLILGIKWRQRRRRLSGPANDRIRGAWAVATNRLIDAGMTITSSSTNSEIAESGIEYAPTADREIHRLASLASAATFGTPARTDLLVDDATSCLGQVETSLSASRSRWQRLRWMLSTRSLRRGTRTPV